MPPEGLVGAAREAMLNAARHAGGTVSLYLETGAAGIELSVTDRGPGFSLDDIPQDRLGVRESIRGRMQRIGGSASVRSGPGGVGTEILLTLPAPSSVEPASSVEPVETLATDRPVVETPLPVDTTTREAKQP